MNKKLRKRQEILQRLGELLSYRRKNIDNITPLFWAIGYDWHDAFNIAKSFNIKKDTKTTKIINGDKQKI